MICQWRKDQLSNNQCLTHQIILMCDTGKSQNFAITEFNNNIILVLSFDHQVCLLMNIFGKQSNLLFFTQERSHMVLFTLEQNIICSQTQLDNIAHEDTIICRQLFAGHVVGFQPIKRKKSLHRMIIQFIHLPFSNPLLVCISIC